MVGFVKPHCLDWLIAFFFFVSFRIVFLVYSGNPTTRSPPPLPQKSYSISGRPSQSRKPTTDLAKVEEVNFLFVLCFLYLMEQCLAMLVEHQEG